MLNLNLFQTPLPTLTPTLLPTHSLLDTVRSCPFKVSRRERKLSPCHSNMMTELAMWQERRDGVNDRTGSRTGQGQGQAKHSCSARSMEGASLKNSSFATVIKALGLHISIKMYQEPLLERLCCWSETESPPGDSSSLCG